MNEVIYRLRMPRSNVDGNDSFRPDSPILPCGAPYCISTIMDTVQTANFDVVDFAFLDSRFKN
jgi:hypothetical protein